MLHSSDVSTLWALMGSAIRMAQLQGLHRDPAAFELPPFEVEMRRRLWWYIITLDSKVSELMGIESSSPRVMDTLLPSNVNDGDLEVGMEMPPQERPGASEMIFCLLQYEITRFLQNYGPRPFGSEPPPGHRPAKEREKRSFADLEGFLEHKFLRFCDPVVPVQFLTATIARSTMCKFKQMAHHRRNRPTNANGERTASPPKSNVALNIAARNIEYDNLIHSSRSLRGFLWFVNFIFPWGAPIFMLKILASRTQWDDEMETAWTQMEELHEHHPEWREEDRIMHFIVGGLTLKAWAAREIAWEAKGMGRPRPPAFITALQTRHAVLSSNQTEPLRSLTTRFVDQDHVNFADTGAYNTINPTQFEFSDPFAGVDWWSGY